MSHCMHTVSILEDLVTILIILGSPSHVHLFPHRITAYGFVMFVGTLQHSFHCSLGWGGGSAASLS